MRHPGGWWHFSAPHRVLAAHTLADVLPVLREAEHWADQGGWAVGVLAYEAAPAFDPALVTHPPNPALPLAWFGLFAAPQPFQPPVPGALPALNWVPNQPHTTYQAAIAAIHAAIARGNTYQVNYTLRLRAQAAPATWPAWWPLMAHAPYGAWVDLGTHQVASASPELFFERAGAHLTTRPMKGTAPRGLTPAEDAAQARWLAGSEKNRAENVMITDMLRNDLGRVARLGSVRVPHLFSLERYPTVWQMTSTITAETAASTTAVMQALFPCASITGAPKTSTMRLIRALEPEPRQTYTGAIGYFAPGQQARFSVAIRTVQVHTGQAEYGVGGGIVWDSTAEDEYAEAMLKARALTHPQPPFALLETLRWSPAEGFYLLAEHRQRLEQSADFFGIPVQWNSVLAALTTSVGGHTGPVRVRLLVDAAGACHVETAPLPPSPPAITVTLAAQPVNSNHLWLYHKTTCREVYEAAQRAHPQAEDVVLWNERGELTETCLGNVVVEQHGEKLTPPVRCGLLAGTLRAHLLERGLIREAVIPKTSLTPNTRLWRINAVRGWQSLTLV